MSSSGPRPAWSGSITFGLVNVPVELYPATRPHKLRARMLDAEGAPLSRRYYCPEDDQDLDDSEIVRGYELPNGEYVTIDDDELDALGAKKSREIDLRLFTERSRLNPAWFEHAYVIVPASEGSKAYRLLAEVMHHAQRIGIATFVLREREYIIAILSDGRCLLGETLRFADELRSLDELELSEAPDEVPAALSAKVQRALAAKQAGKFDPSELVDPGHAKLEQLLERKQKHGEVTARAEIPHAEAEGGGADVIDLMEILQRSLRDQSKAKPKSTRKPLRR